MLPRTLAAVPLIALSALAASLSAREGVIEIEPTAIYAHAITDDMPAAFKERQIPRVMFDVSMKK
jgi:hypothetical protein